MHIAATWKKRASYRKLTTTRAMHKILYWTTTQDAGFLRVGIFGPWPGGSYGWNIDLCTIHGRFDSLVGAHAWVSGSIPGWAPARDRWISVSHIYLYFWLSFSFLVSVSPLYNLSLSCSLILPPSLKLMIKVILS